MTDPFVGSRRLPNGPTPERLNAASAVVGGLSSVVGLLPMGDPKLWAAFVVLFAVAGLLNLFRGLRRTDARRPVSLALALSSFVWSAAAGLFRFVSPGAGYAMAALAAALMVWAALAGFRARR